SWRRRGFHYPASVRTAHRAAEEGAPEVFRRSRQASQRASERRLSIGTGPGKGRRAEHRALGAVAAPRPGRCGRHRTRTVRVAGIPGTPFSSPDPQAADLLAQALKLTQGIDIAVFPVLDLLTWGGAVPRDADDLTITGHTSVQDSERRFRRSLLRTAASGGPP